MRVVTSGEWKGNLTVEDYEMENSDGSHNFTYITSKKEDEVEIVLRLRPGKTDMKLEVKARRD